MKLPGANAFLHRRNHLDADDKVIESVKGEFVTMTVDGVEQPMPESHFRVKAAKMPRSLRWCAGTYTSRRLFFGLPASVAIVDMEWLWRVETSGTTLTAVFNWPLRVVRWKAYLKADEVAAFAGRLLAQRERRIAELPAEMREQVASWSARLDRSCALEAALAGPVPQPRTVIGAWLRAYLRDETEKAQELAAVARQDGERPGDAAVIQAALELLIGRVVAAGPGAGMKSVLWVAPTGEQGEPADLRQG